MVECWLVAISSNCDLGYLLTAQCIQKLLVVYRAREHREVLLDGEPLLFLFYGSLLCGKCLLRAGGMV